MTTRTVSSVSLRITRMLIVGAVLASVSHLGVVVTANAQAPEPPAAAAGMGLHVAVGQSLAQVQRRAATSV